MAPNLLTLLVLVTGAVATVSDQVIANYCSGPKYITLNLNATGINGPFILPSGQAYVYNITGTGNSATIANEAANVGGEVPRLDLGTSTDNAILYWYDQLLLQSDDILTEAQGRQQPDRRSVRRLELQHHLQRDHSERVPERNRLVSYVPTPSSP